MRVGCKKINRSHTHTHTHTDRKQLPRLCGLVVNVSAHAKIAEEDGPKTMFYLYRYISTAGVASA